MKVHFVSVSVLVTTLYSTMVSKKYVFIDFHSIFRIFGKEDYAICKIPLNFLPGGLRKIYIAEGAAPYNIRTKRFEGRWGSGGKVVTLE